jgi:hypothetical protein
MGHLTALLTTIKTYGLKLIFIIMALFTPIKPFIMLIFAAIVIDTILGIYASIIVKKEVISNKLFNIVIKFFIYVGAMIFTYQTDILILGDFIGLFIGIPLALTKIIGLIFISVEIFSIDEKMRKINGKGIWFYVKRFLGVVKKIKVEKDELGINK